jgi:hypothetical protein
VTPLDAALRARFLELRVRADRKTWLAWAEAHGVHPVVLDVARNHDRFVETVPPRTWKYVSDVLHTLGPAELRRPQLVQDLLGGYLPGPWIEVVRAGLRSQGSDIDFDLYAVLRSYGPDAKERAAVVRFRDEGKTDRLDEIVARISSLLDSPEVGVLASRDAFSLSAFEALLADLPGDQREALQDAFARNPVSVSLLGVAPDTVIKDYGSGVGKKIAAWLASPTQRHRAWAIAAHLATALPKRADVVELKKNNLVRTNLARFAGDLGPVHGKALIQALERLGIPVPSAKAHA